MPQKPDIVKLEYQNDSSLYFKRLQILRHPVWLDSGKPASTFGRYDIISAQPVDVLIDAPITAIENAVSKLTSDTDFSTVRQLQLPFCGGAIGFFNYEYSHEAFGLHAPQEAGANAFGIFNWCVVQDHQKQVCFAVFLPSCNSETKTSMLNLLDTEAAEPDLAFTASQLTMDTSRHDYLAAVEKIHSLILAGDTYQINLSQRFHGQFDGSAAGAYLKLRKASPSPYAAYLDLTEQNSILCLSPEQFITIDGGKAITRPIKGTAARSANPFNDRVLAQDLLNSKKNRAENLMIVDLLRNDFSKCCELNSVKAPVLCELESFANVHHLVSTVEGIPKQGITPLEFLMHCFPGGSITGAPKRRSMEIIDQLEKHRRGIYCGSICYLSAHGRFDSNIAIRTVLIENNHFYCWGGGGIVADSDAEEEYAESIQKIQLLLDTLRKQN